MLFSLTFFFLFFWSVASLSWDINPRYGEICWDGCSFPVGGPETLSVFLFPMSNLRPLVYWDARRILA